MNRMVRDRGRRAVLALEAGGWDEPLAALRAIFDMDEPTARGKTLVEAFEAEANERRQRVEQRLNFERGFGQREAPNRFEPVVDPAALRRHGREHPMCVVCGRPGVPHHVIYKSVLRLDLPWNLLTLCSGSSGNHHTNDSPVGFHRLGGHRWLRLHRRQLPRNVVRNLIVVLFVVRPWIERGGRPGATLVTRRNT